MNLRSFTDRGVAEAHALLDSMKAGGSQEIDVAFLTDDSLSRDMGVSLGKVPREFASRFELALWLQRTLDSVLDDEADDQVGHWTWLAFALFDVIAPKRANGERKIGEHARYVLEPDNWQRYYRHLLAAPCKILRAHFKELHITKAILSGRPDSPGDLYEQIAGRQEVITSATLVRLTKTLYWDEGEKRLKRGAAGKGPGAARRLGLLLTQFDLTWDLVDMPDDALQNLLPQREFVRFLAG